ncbi:toxin-antitoxin system, toxin component [Streptomyces sp. BV286]|uniref:toxin-antitoxin system, toxin component n=1 Tax=Streptomyces sp. BV286 TaxID=2849672 RepID=UPI001C2E5FDE|nr:toxin-antitoxin system, toxin component [Streptomyces sp. BV286]MBV1940800.1 toxin-antitoxin system, toxin component [Streptomyces sp. BV286]
MKKISNRAVAREQRKLMADLGAAVTAAVDVPAEPTAIFEALCDAMSVRRERPVLLSIRAFPPELASHTTGLWLDLPEQDVIVVEESLAPPHKLVVLGHEFWHMYAGHCGHDVDGGSAAARAALATEVDWPELARRVASRSHSHQEEEVSAEGFGLLLGTKMRGWLADPNVAAPPPIDDVAHRLGVTLGYRGLQG